MWNHSSKKSKSAEKRVNFGGGGDILEKMEKHLDLTNYLNFLQNLFSLSTSDSEESDVESKGTGVIGQGTLTTNTKEPKKSATLQSQVNNASPDASTFSRKEDENSFLPSDLTPMSELELNNLLKRTNYLGTDVDVDPTTFDLDAQDTPGDSDEKKEGKKKKKKAKKKANADEIQRNNRPNSGGRGNGHGSSKGDAAPGSGGCNNGPVSDNSGNSGGKSSSNNSGGGAAGGGSQINSRKCARKQSFAHTTKSSTAAPGKSTDSLDTSTKTGNLSQDDGLCLDEFDMHQSVFSGSLGLRLEGDSDDNDSLSDYMSMAATAAASTSQVVATRPSSSSEEGCFQFDEFSNGSSSLSDDGGSLYSVGGNGKRKRYESETCSQRKKLLLQKQAEYIELMNVKRRKLYVFIVRKEIPKAYRTRFTINKDMIAARRRLVQGCSRAVRQKAIQSQKTMKESMWRAKRLTREMQGFWKQADRLEKDIKKRKEKQEEEQRKQDVEAWEAKRQQQKLNFLITQTELFAHLMAKNLNGISKPDEQEFILNKLKYENNGQQILEDFDFNSMKLKAKLNVQEAVQIQQVHLKLFDVNSSYESRTVQTTQPKASLFSGELKNYQVKGLDWLDNLFREGMDGILADEMGLGKNIQSIAFLAEIAGKHGIWGPFLILAPVSTLHNWQQEIRRFVPDFKVIPYWGNPHERKILRQFWKQANLHTAEASFHVVVTSSNIVVQDMKYFNKVKWQYLIVDEAQKPTNNNRWKALSGFSCRNRLLLTGSPIQSSMSELWSLLQFTMPSLFDSPHFIDWFATNQEFHVENGSAPDEKLIARLFTILKPFMLRRTKKDVESELCDKSEILVPCQLSNRQRFFHTALVRKILMDDILKIQSSSSPNNSAAGICQQQISRNLTNLLVQFRKICNHPGLFERRDMKSSFFMKAMPHFLPKLLNEDNRPSVNPKFNIFHPANIHCSLFQDNYNCSKIRVSKRNIEDVHVANVEDVCEWSFLRYSGLGVGEIWNWGVGEIHKRIKYLVNLQEILRKLNLKQTWDKSSDGLSPSDFLLCGPFSQKLESSTTLNKLIFTSHVDSFYGWTDALPKLPDCIGRLEGVAKIESDSVIINEKSGHLRGLERLFMPKFLTNICTKVKSEGFQPQLLDGCDVKWKATLSTSDFNAIMYGSAEGPRKTYFLPANARGLLGIDKIHGWSGILLPDKEKLVTDSGKLKELDNLLRKLKSSCQQVLIYSVMPAMLDILEEYLRNRKWLYNRLDGFPTGSRSDNLDFNTKSDNFVTLLSARIDGMALDFNAFDSVIFYDSDWNSFADHQEMDLIQRIGQTKQVTIYRFFCKGTVEERILQKTKDKLEVEEGPTNSQFRVDELKPKELLSLLLDDEDCERKYRQRQLQEKKVNEKSTEKPCSVNQVPTSTPVSVQTSEAAATTTPCAEADSKTAETSSGGSLEDSSPSSQEDSDEMDCDIKDTEVFSLAAYEDEMNPSTSDYFDDYSRAIDWNGSMSDEEGVGFISKKSKLTRGTGKRGRPPSRVRVQMRDLGGVHSMRRGPGRPRIKPIGPLNQGIRGRRPGRPPLSRKAETIPTSLPALSPGQRGVYGMYTPDLNHS